MARVDVFVDEIAAFAVRDGVVYLTLDDGRCAAMPLVKFRRTLAKAERAMAEHDAKRAEVVPMRGRGKRGEH